MIEPRAPRAAPSAPSNGDDRSSTQRDSETGVHARHRVASSRRRSTASRSRGRSPWYLAWRRLRRNYVALAFLGVFVADRRRVRAGAGVREARRAHGPERRTTSPTRSRSTAVKSTSSRRAARSSTRRPASSRVRPVHDPRPDAGGTPAASSCSAPTRNGRDVAVRLLYGGRNSLKVGIGSALICTLLRDRPRAARRLLRRLDRLA